MKAILFSKWNSIQKLEVRHNLIRIPEILYHLKKAQNLLEEMGLTNIDLVHSFTFNENMKKEMRNMLLACVHIGLYQRYEKKYGKPEFFVTPGYPESPISICLGRSTFENLVLDSGLFRAQTLIQFPSRTSSEELLQFDPFIFSQISLEKYSVYHSNGYGNKKLVFESQSSDKVIEKLIKKYDIRKFVNIGPEEFILHHDCGLFAEHAIELQNSIDLDPMMGWFWGDIAI